MIDWKDERCINCGRCRLCKKLDGDEWHYFYVCAAYTGVDRISTMLYIGGWDDARRPNSRCELWRERELAPWKEEDCATN